MARLHPGAELLMHDVAIRTRFRVVGHVRITAGVDKRVSPYTHGQAERDTQNDSACELSIHLT